MKKFNLVLAVFIIGLLFFVTIILKASHKVIKTKSDISNCLTIMKDYPIPGSSKRFDYQSVDNKRSLLFIAHLGDNSVMVFNLKSSTIIKTLNDIPSPHGILAVPELNRVYVSATGKDEIYVIDEQSLKILAKVPAGNYPDGIAYAPNTNRIFVSDESGKTVTVINALNNNILATIKMGGEVGNTHYDSVSKLIYSAVQTKDELVSIDPGSMKIVSRYNLPGCKGAHGFYIDEETHYAFITGEDNGSYIVFDLTAKKVIFTGKVGKEPDVIAFDKGYHFLYVASESGIVSVFELRQSVVNKVCEGFLADHAHTVAVDQLTHKVYFPLQNINGIPIIRIMKPVKH